MQIDTIKWQGAKKNKLRGKVRIIDQTQLPLKLKYLYCSDINSLWDAIYNMHIRGAPAIGVAAAFALVLGARDSKAKTFLEFKNDLHKAKDFIASSRPTAVNLFWALKRMLKAANANKSLPVPLIKEILLKEALKIRDEDRLICRQMARFGSRLIKDKDRILTFCNAGALATADYGTALGVIYRAKEEGKSFKVYACETRPFLQGSRLTCWELKRKGIDVTLICDNMAAYLMQKNKISKVFVGADRIAKNGDAANKIGTYNIAILARYHSIPFYVVAPISTFDLSLKSGKEIPIEQRSEDEVRKIQGVSIAPKGVNIENPAFDVTPFRLISAIVTEKGIIKPPFKIKEFLK